MPPHWLWILGLRGALQDHAIDEKTYGGLDRFVSGLVLALDDSALWLSHVAPVAAPIS